MADMAVQLHTLSGSMELVLGYDANADDDALDYFLKIISRLAAFANKAAGMDPTAMHLDELLAYNVDMPPDDEKLKPPPHQPR